MPAAAAHAHQYDTVDGWYRCPDPGCWWNDPGSHVKGGAGPLPALTAADLGIIAQARKVGPALRASSGDRDRLAGWLLAELADLAERLSPPGAASARPR